MQLTLTGYSTALFSTWYFVEELGLLFDAGDGVAASLLQKSRKIEHIFLSHADRDHITGLLRLNELNARPGLPHLYFPADARSFGALASFSGQFDTRVAQTTWQGIGDGEVVPVQNDLFVQGYRNSHVVKALPHEVKSLSYQVYRTKRKLKPELLGMHQEQLVQLIGQVGREQLTDEVRTNLLAYSGDTPTDQMARWEGAGILIHEATFLTRAEATTLDANRNQHSILEDVLALAADLTLDALILGHFSSRYSASEIDAAIRRFYGLFKLKIPVYRLLPGQTHWNILNSDPVN